MSKLTPYHMGELPPIGSNFPPTFGALELALVANLSPAWKEAARTNRAAYTDTVGAWDDLSGNGRNATQSSAASEPTLTAGDAADGPHLTYDGSNDFMSIAADAVFLTPPFTIVRRFQLSTLPSVASQAATVSNKHRTGGAAFSWRLLVANANDILSWTSRTSGDAAVNIPTLAALSIDIWYNVIATMDGSFNNELFLGTTSQGTSSPGSLITSNPLTLSQGAFNASSNRMDGKDEVSLFYSKVLSADEIAILDTYLG